MKVTKKAKSLYEIEFDAYEVKQLADMTSIALIDSRDFIRRSVEDKLNSLLIRIDQVIDAVYERMEADNGYAGTDNSSG